MLSRLAESHRSMNRWAGNHVHTPLSPLLDEVRFPHFQDNNKLNLNIPLPSHPWIPSSILSPSFRTFPLQTFSLGVRGLGGEPSQRPDSLGKSLESEG